MKIAKTGWRLGEFQYDCKSVKKQNENKVFYFDELRKAVSELTTAIKDTDSDKPLKAKSMHPSSSMVVSSSKNTSNLKNFHSLKKEFDHVNRNKLFSKLLKRDVPVCFIRILQYKCSKQTMQVYWGSNLYEKFGVLNSVRQGGVTSPYLFALYVHDLSCELSAINAG